MLGFEHDMDGPNCRFIVDGLTVDVMPVDGEILGFTNRWYELAVQFPCEYLLPSGDSIRLISAPIFVATKLEAFRDRGQADFVMSHDIEDIIAVIDGREELYEEIRTSDSSVREYIREQFANLLTDCDFVDAIGMHLLPDAASQARAIIILDRVRAISIIS
jgi:predicted nucleotidyltransferase